jgi:hypothetical protein
VDQNGLLQTVNGSTTDQTVNSIGSLVAAAGAAFTFAAGIAAAVPADMHVAAFVAQKPAPAYSYHATIDPSGLAEGASLTSQSSTVTVPESGLPGMIPLASNSVSVIQNQFKITITRKDAVAINPQTAELTGKNGVIDGIVVRLPIRYEVQVVSVFEGDANYNGSDDRTSAQQVILLPDDTQNYVLPIDRTPLVSNSTQVTLAGGMLQSYNISRPSLVAGIVGIPKTILGALAPVPMNIYQTQDSYYKAKDDAAKASSDTKAIQ